MMRTHVKRLLLFAAVAWIVSTAASASPIVLDANGVKDLNNLQTIALALRNYNDANNGFPAEFSTSSTNTPLLSWRVAILPYIGDSALYNQFQLDQAWNSTANLALLAQMPDVYRSPGEAPGSTDTGYAGGSALGTMFNGTPGVKLSSVTDGTSNTLLVGETDNASIPWTAPEDISLGSCPTLGGSGFSSFIPGAVPFAFVDGSVGLLPDAIDCSTLLGLFVRNDRQGDRSALVDFTVAAPEPTSLVLLGTGVVTLVGRRFRRRRSTPHISQ